MDNDALNLLLMKLERLKDDEAQLDSQEPQISEALERLALALAPRQKKARHEFLRQIDRLTRELDSRETLDNDALDSLGREAARTLAASRLTSRIFAINNLVLEARKQSDELLIGSKALPEFLEVPPDEKME